MRARVLAVLLLFTLAAASASAHFTYRTAEGFGVLMLESTDPPIATIPVRLTFYVSNSTSGEPIRDLEVVHERRMHIFIVGQDLETFAHVHAEDEGGTMSPEEGMYSVAYAFPAAGEYRVVVDYTAQGRNVIQSFPVFVINPPLGGSYLSTLQPDFRREGTFNGYTVRLDAPARIRANETVEFTYHVERAAEEVRDLQQYLGSELHVFIIDGNLSLPGHGHTYVPGHGVHVGSMPQRYTGPNVPFRYTFEEPGTYALFGQLQHNGSAITTRFLVRVEPPYEMPYRAIGIAASAALLLAGIILLAKLRR